MEEAHASSSAGEGSTGDGSSQHAWLVTRRPSALSSRSSLYVVGKAFALWRKVQKKKIEHKAIKYVSCITVMLLQAFLTVPSATLGTSNFYHLAQGSRLQPRVGPP